MTLIKRIIRTKPHRISTSIHACCLLVLMFLSTSTPSLFASEVVLEEIKLSATENKTTIDIEFGLPLSYVKHFPQTAGEILQVQLSIDGGDERTIHKEVRQGSDLRPPPGLEPILIYVTYEEGVPGGPYLTLRFSRRVEFKVTIGKILTSLSIELIGVGLKMEETIAPAAPTTAPVDILMQPGQFGESKPDVAADEASAGEPSPTKPRQPVGQARQGDDTDQLMAKARQALTFGDNTGAIELLRKIIRMPDNEHTQDARELLGLALERSNQIPRAKFEYKKYLQQYKEGAGPDRVRQRLIALRNIGTEQRQKLRQTRRSTAGDKFNVFGRLSQAFDKRNLLREAENDDDNVGPEDTELSRRLTSNLNIRGRYSDSDTVFQTVLATNHTYDYTNSDYSETRTSDLYVEYEDLKQGYSTSIGRQRARNSGVYDRFDGLQAGYKVNEWVTTGISTGEIVSFYDQSYSKEFTGANVEIGQRKSIWAGHAYFVQQGVESLTDRRAVGGGVRYSTKTLSVFAIADYDLLFEEVGLLNARVGWQLSEKAKLNVSYNERQLLNISSALNGMAFNPTSSTAVELDDLIAVFTEDELRTLAKNRVSRSITATVGGTYQFNKDQQVNMDVTMFESDGTELTQFEADDIFKTIPATEGTGEQYTYSAQWISTNAFAEQDLYVLGLRYSDFSTYEESTLYVNTRLPNLDKWRPRPRLSFSNRDYDKCETASCPDGTRQSIALSAKVDYRWKRKWVLDMELGREWVTYSDINPNWRDEERDTVRIGYSYTF